MSTIASPRDPSGPFPRRTNSSIITPTSSSRPSLDIPASASGSPNPNASSASSSSTNPQSKRATRAALREYYNLRNTTTAAAAAAAAANKPLPSTPTVEITDHFSPPPGTPSLPSELDAPTFHAPAYVADLLRTGTLADLLRTYARVLSEMRALDAEKKALVYDNYSKLIAATETIRRMRAAQHADALAGGALEAVVERIYRQAVGLREGLRASIRETGTASSSSSSSGEDGGEGDGRKRQRTRELAREVVKVPGRVRRLVEEGREEEARREWEVPRRLLIRWKELGVGGEEVASLIEEGDAALRGGREGEGDDKSEPDSSAASN